MGFKDQLNKDLNVFFNSEELADIATLNGVEISVVFDDKEDVVFDTGLDSDVATSTPCIDCMESDVMLAEYNDEVVVNSITYYIIDMDRPINGTRKIYLSEDMR